MKTIEWELRMGTINRLASDLIREGNQALNLNDRGIWNLAPMVGREIEQQFDYERLFEENDYSGNEALILSGWIEHGFTLEDFPDWTGPQMMGAYAAYLVDDVYHWLDDLPEPGGRYSDQFNGWDRHEIIEHCASSLLEAMEVCHYGRLLIGKTIVPDEEWLAEHVKRHDSEKARRASIAGKWQSQFEDKWKDHCRRAMKSGCKIDRLPDLLNIEDYDPEITKIEAPTLRRWAREVGITFKRGRPKN